MNIIKNTDLIDEIIQYYRYLEELTNSNSVNKNWITPLDIELAKSTSAFEIDRSTNHLFKHKKRDEGIKNLISNAEILERTAAGHYWINESLSGNLGAMKGVSINLLESLQTERKGN